MLSKHAALLVIFIVSLVVGLGLLVGIGFFVYRRRKKLKLEQDPPVVTAQDVQEIQSPPQNASDEKKQSDFLEIKTRLQTHYNSLLELENEYNSIMQNNTNTPDLEVDKKVKVIRAKKTECLTKMHKIIQENWDLVDSMSNVSTGKQIYKEETDARKFGIIFLESLELFVKDLLC